MLIHVEQLACEKHFFNCFCFLLLLSINIVIFKLFNLCFFMYFINVLYSGKNPETREDELAPVKPNSLLMEN